MNVRYLQRAGMDRPAAVAAVAVNTAAGALVHVLGLLVAAVLIGRATLGAAHVPRAGRYWWRWWRCSRAAGWPCGRRSDAGGLVPRRCGRPSWPGAAPSR